MYFHCSEHSGNFTDRRAVYYVKYKCHTTLNYGLKLHNLCPWALDCGYNTLICTYIDLWNGACWTMSYEEDVRFSKATLLTHSGFPATKLLLSRDLRTLINKVSGQAARSTSQRPNGTGSKYPSASRRHFTRRQSSKPAYSWVTDPLPSVFPFSSLWNPPLCKAYSCLSL